jgi:hypothetical protein
LALTEALLLSVEPPELEVGLEEGGRDSMDGGGLENDSEVFVEISGSVGR